jgi:hypothetical protein
LLGNALRVLAMNAAPSFRRSSIVTAICLSEQYCV